MLPRRLPRSPLPLAPGIGLALTALALAAASGVVACAAPADDADADGAASAIGASAPNGSNASTATGRDVRCTMGMGGQDRSLRLQLGPVGGAASATMYPRDTFSVTTERSGDSVLVRLVGEGQTNQRTELRFPAALWNDPSRAATEAGTPIFREPFFDADVVTTTAPLTRPRCELEFAPVGFAVRSPLSIEGADAERLFDAMQTQVSPWEDSERRTSGRRPYGSKTVEMPNLYRFQCINYPPGRDFNEIAGAEERTSCTLSMAAHVARRGQGTTTYRMTLTERERAGRFFNAFENTPFAGGVGFEVTSLHASGARTRGPLAGTKMRIVCRDIGDLKTTCELELVTAPVE